MSNKKTEELLSTKDTLYYSLAGVADVMSYQMFSFYIFIFYFSVKGLIIDWVTFGFILWSIWNAINDPLLGTLSDRTASKWGRRRPWIILSLIPTCLLIVFLWTPIGDPISIFIYFLIIIMLFDTFYTMYSLNQTSLFPEMYTDLQARAKANNYVQIFNIIGLLIATLLPSLFISDFKSSESAEEYVISGVVAAILFIIIALIFVRFGIKERSEYLKDAEKAPSFTESIKFTFNNKSFKTYVLANLSVWYVFGLIPVINTYFLEFVVGISGAMIHSIFLAIIFVSAIVFMVFWRNFFAKHGARKAEIIALGTLIVTLIPLLIVWEIIGAIIAYVLAGFGFAGIMFGRDVMMSTIIDADEIETGLRREASYYGVNALVIRLSTIFVYLSIGLVFRNIGWYIFEIESITVFTIIGLRLLMSIFPAVALSLGMLSLRKFPITKEKYEEIKVKLERLHGEKKESV